MMEPVVKKKIVIVDDDNRNVFALSVVLRSKKYECLSAPGGPELLQLLAGREDVGVILLDMMMPEMDGYTIIPILKQDEQTAHIPVIAVTAQAMPGDREKCIDAGADEYLSKPVNVDNLIILLNKYLK